MKGQFVKKGTGKSTGKIGKLVPKYSPKPRAKYAKAPGKKRA